MTIIHADALEVADIVVAAITAAVLEVVATAIVIPNPLAIGSIIFLSHTDSDLERMKLFSHSKQIFAVVFNQILQFKTFQGSTVRAK